MAKLRAWTTESTSSRTMWISSPYESGLVVSGSGAAAMVTVAAAWQAETPILSAFCRRPRQERLRPGLTVEQAGLISLAYGLIRQLLQFDGVLDRVSEVNEEDVKALNGEASTWENALSMLRELLKHVPLVTFCVIDGLNEFEWGNGAAWCKQFVAVLRDKQERTEGAFNILFSTAGQSRVLPKYVEVVNRHMAAKRATEVGKAGAAGAVWK